MPPLSFMPPLNRYLDLADRWSEASRSPTCFEATGDCFPDILQTFRFRSSVRDASGDRGAFGNDHAGLIRLQRNEKLYTRTLAGLTSRLKLVASRRELQG